MIEDFKNFSAFTEENDPIRILMVGETYCNKHFRISREKSDLNALEFIIDGSGTLDIEGQHMTVGKGDVFVLRKGTRHCYEADENDPWHKYWVVFDGKLAETLFESFLPSAVYVFRNCDVKKFFEDIFNISRQDISYEVMMEKITVDLLHIFMCIRSRNLLINEDLADLIRKKLDESVENPFNLDELCKSINYSKNYVINVFSDKFKITPYQYFLSRKIDAAKAYLTHTDMSIGSIAKKLQYADQQYFSYSFKKAAGISPLAYRKKTRK